MIWAGTEVQIDSIEYLITKESDITGTLTETEVDCRYQNFEI